MTEKSIGFVPHPGTLCTLEDDGGRYLLETHSAQEWITELNQYGRQSVRASGGHRAADSVSSFALKMLLLPVCCLPSSLGADGGTGSLQHVVSRLQPPKPNSLTRTPQDCRMDGEPVVVQQEGTSRGRSADGVLPRQSYPIPELHRCRLYRPVFRKSSLSQQQRTYGILPARDVSGWSISVRVDTRGSLVGLDCRYRTTWRSPALTELSPATSPVATALVSCARQTSRDRGQPLK